MQGFVVVMPPQVKWTLRVTLYSEQATRSVVVLNVPKPLREYLLIVVTRRAAVDARNQAQKLSPEQYTFSLATRLPETQGERRRSRYGLLALLVVESAPPFEEARVCEAASLRRIAS